MDTVLVRPFHDATSGMYAVNARAMPILGWIVRLVGLVLAIVQLFAGFVPVLFDEWRRTSGLPGGDRRPLRPARLSLVSEAAKAEEPE